MRLVFPSGAYRTMKYTLDKDSGTISFEDGVFIYGSYSSPNITSCKYVARYLMGAPFVTFYDAEDPNKIDIEKGEWSITITAMTSALITPLLEIDCEYGTTSNHSNIGIEIGPEWSTRIGLGVEEYAFTIKYDLASIYWGPDWHLPYTTDAEVLLRYTTANVLPGQPAGHLRWH